jgi:AraC-like DNA-binding protein
MEQPQEQSAASTLPPTALGLSTREALRLLVEKRVDPAPLLKAAGLAAFSSGMGQARMPIERQIRFLELVSAALDDDLLGMHLASRFEPREAGLLYYVMASSETFSEALRRIERYTALVSDAVRLKRLTAGKVGLECAYVGVARHKDRQQIEFFIAVIAKIARQLTGLRATPARVTMAHPALASRQQAEAMLGCAITYNARSDSIIFAPEIGDCPNVLSDHYLNQILVGYCEEALASGERSPGALRTQVENTIAPLLPHGQVSAANVARALGVTERSLQRRLAIEGASFSDILRDLRLSLARRYLQSPQTSISEISWLLGFQDASAFSHFFRRWTGKRPSEERLKGS